MDSKRNLIMQNMIENAKIINEKSDVDGYRYSLQPDVTDYGGKEPDENSITRKEKLFSLVDDYEKNGYNLGPNAIQYRDIMYANEPDLHIKGYVFAYEESKGIKNKDVLEKTLRSLKLVDGDFAENKRVEKPDLDKFKTGDYGVIDGRDVLDFSSIVKDKLFLETVVNAAKSNSKVTDLWPDRADLDAFGKNYDNALERTSIYANSFNKKHVNDFPLQKVDYDLVFEDDSMTMLAEQAEYLNEYLDERIDTYYEKTNRLVTKQYENYTNNNSLTSDYGISKFKYKDKSITYDKNQVAVDNIMSKYKKDVDRGFDINMYDVQHADNWDALNNVLKTYEEYKSTNIALGNITYSKENAKNINLDGLAKYMRDIATVDFSKQPLLPDHDYHEDYNNRFANRWQRDHIGSKYKIMETPDDDTIAIAYKPSADESKSVIFVTDDKDAVLKEDFFSIEEIADNAKESQFAMDLASSSNFQTLPTELLEYDPKIANVLINSVTCDRHEEQENERQQAIHSLADKMFQNIHKSQVEKYAAENKSKDTNDKDFSPAD